MRSSPPEKSQGQKSRGAPRRTKFAARLAAAETLFFRTQESPAEFIRREPSLPARLKFFAKLGELLSCPPHAGLPTGCTFGFRRVDHDCSSELLLRAQSLGSPPRSPRTQG